MENGTRVRVINECGNKCAVGVYHGSGVPKREVNAALPEMSHYAVLVGSELRYYPTGFFTLQAAQQGD